MTEHWTALGNRWPKYLSIAMFAYNTFNILNLANYSPHELVFGRKPKLLLDLETNPDIIWCFQRLLHVTKQKVTVFT